MKCLISFCRFIELSVSLELWWALGVDDYRLAGKQDYSAERILMIDWIDGEDLRDFIEVQVGWKVVGEGCINIYFHFGSKCVSVRL